MYSDFSKIADFLQSPEYVTAEWIEVLEKHRNVGLDSMVHRFIVISKYLIPESKNIFETIEKDNESTSIQHCIDATNQILKDLSDSELRNVYNDIYPKLGDDLYKYFYNQSFNETCSDVISKHRSKAQNSKREFKPEIDYSKFKNQEMTSRVLDLFEDFSKCFLLNETQSNITCDFYRYLTFIRDDVRPIAQSQECETYMEYFGYMGLDGWFKTFLKTAQSDLVDRFDCTDLFLCYNKIMQQ